MIPCAFSELHAGGRAKQAMAKIKVGILGATGLVGQRLVSLLADHPWFEIAGLAASERSAGKRYAQACRWKISAEIPSVVRDLVVQPCRPGLDAPLIFSGLPSAVAGPIEVEFARAGYILASNASAHRMDPDVPLVLPEVNPDHLAMIERQRQRRGWSGALITNSNCTSMPVVMALKPLDDAFGVQRVFVGTMQAASGAGYPGIPVMDLIDNVMPHTEGEERKVETEPLKMLGRFDGERFLDAEFRISAHCHRVAVEDGHMVALSVELREKPSVEDVAAALAEWRALPQELGLPMAPRRPVVVRREPDRPQPKFDRMTERGMATVVGRLRPCPLLDFKLLALSHNTIRGAAGGAVLNGELLKAQGYLD